MVYSEHDANFYALDKQVNYPVLKSGLQICRSRDCLLISDLELPLNVLLFFPNQLNQEAASLDWTRSVSRTLNGSKLYNHCDNGDYTSDISINLPQKLGGNASGKLPSARESSVAAAYWRTENAAMSSVVINEANAEPDPDGSGFDSSGEEKVHTDILHNQKKLDLEPDPDDHSETHRNFEPDPDDSQGIDVSLRDNKIISKVPLHTDQESADLGMLGEPDPDDSNATEETVQSGETMREPDPDDSVTAQNALGYGDNKPVIVQAEPDPDDSLRDPQQASGMQIDEPDPDDQELLKRIQDPVAVLCNRMHKAIVILQNEVGPVEASRVLQTLVKIIRYDALMNLITSQEIRTRSSLLLLYLR